MNAHAELDALIHRYWHVALAHAALHFHRAARSVHRAGEFDQNAVAGPLDDPAAMLGNFGLQEAAPKYVDPRERALFVSAHQPAVAGDVAGKNCCQSALDPLARHILPPQPGSITLATAARNGHGEAQHS